MPNFGDTASTLALVYGLCALYNCSRVRWLFAKCCQLDSVRLFVLSVLVACVLRMGTWIGIACLAYKSSVNVSDNPLKLKTEVVEDDEERAQGKIYSWLFIMSDLPDFITLSAYTLLALVWAEILVVSRLHSLADGHISKLFLRRIYVLFNALLYATQFGLYVNILAHPNNENPAKLACFIISVVNWSLPFCFAAFFVYFNIKFAGFPCRSRQDRDRLRSTSQVILVWTVGRVVWGIAIFTTALDRFNAYFSTSWRVRSLIFVLVCVVCEIVPFVVALDKELLTLISAHLPETLSEFNDSTIAVDDEDLLPSSAMDTEHTSGSASKQKRSSDLLEESSQEEEASCYGEDGFLANGVRGLPQFMAESLLPSSPLFGFRRQVPPGQMAMRPSDSQASDLDRTFSSLSEGSDSGETPLPSTVDARRQQALRSDGPPPPPKRSYWW